MMKRTVEEWQTLFSEQLASGLSARQFCVQRLPERYANLASGTSQWTSYLWLGGQPIGLVKGNTLYWVHADHLAGC